MKCNFGLPGHEDCFNEAQYAVPTPEGDCHMCESCFNLWLDMTLPAAIDSALHEGLIQKTEDGFTSTEKGKRLVNEEES